MKQLFFSFAIGAALSLSSCGQPAKKTDEGEIREQEYFSREIGWVIEIPRGWEVVDLEKIKESSEKGTKIIEKSTNMKIDDNNLRNLVSFKSNQFNIFQSNSEPFKVEYEGEWEENNKKLKGIIYDTYQNQGIAADSSATTIEKINGLDFYRYDFTLFGPKGKVILKQIMYNKFINGFSFGVCISYNNEKDKNVMLEAFRKSTFNKRI